MAASTKNHSSGTGHGHSAAEPQPKTIHRFPSAGRAVASGDLAGGGFSAGNRGFPAGLNLRAARRNTEIVIQIVQGQTGKNPHARHYYGPRQIRQLYDSASLSSTFADFGGTGKRDFTGLLRWRGVFAHPCRRRGVQKLALPPRIPKDSTIYAPQKWQKSS